MRIVAHAIVLAVAVAGLALGLFFEDHFHGLMQEDAAAEWATFIAFVLAALMSVHYFVRSSKRLDRFGAVCLFVFCAFVAGEEISWGHRVLAFEPPAIFLEHNFQQELNVHNLLKKILDTRWMVVIVALGYGVVLPVATRLRFFVRYIALSPSILLVPWFVVVALLEIIYPFQLTGEFAELLLGLVFVIDLGERLSNPSRAVLALSVSLVLAVLVTPMLEAMIYGDQDTNRALVRGELEQIATDARRPKTIRRKLKKKRRVHKRIYTAIKSRYLRFDEHSVFLEGRKDRRDRRGFFLDVWNQPYWVIYRRSANNLVFYSFGPNRRRDWDTKSSTVAAGDDVLVVVPIR